MDLVRAGAILRAIRISRRERIVDVAATSGLSRSAISRIERGEAHGAPLVDFERLARALAATVELSIGYRGADLDRLRNAAHSALHERVARLFASLPAWQAVPEVSFSIYGERGVVDWLAWHAASRSLLIVEIKSAVVDVQALLAQVDRYLRLARTIAAGQGWEPISVSVWLVLEDSTRNRRAIGRHAVVLGSRLTADGVAMRRWLRNPRGSIMARSFLADSRGPSVRPKRVRFRASDAARRAKDLARGRMAPT